MRAFYRIKRSDWPLTIDGESSTAGSVAVGGTQALLIVHSSIYPNADLEALTSSKLLGHTYADVASNGIATATQVAKVFETEYEQNGERGRSKSDKVPADATVRRTNLIPHSWGGRESKTEQTAMDALG